MAYLYTILFSNGLIKVGMTGSEPEKRITTHAAALSVAKIDVKDYEFIECDSDCVKESERSLINQCKEASPTGQKSKEWFYGLDFLSVVQWMRDIATCAKTQQKNQSQDSNATASSDLRAEAMETVKAAILLSKMSDADSDTIISAMGYNRQKIILMCWEMIAEAEKSGLSGEESLDNILDKVSRKMSFCLW